MISVEVALDFIERYEEEGCKRLRIELPARGLLSFETLERLREVEADVAFAGRRMLYV